MPEHGHLAAPQHGHYALPQYGHLASQLQLQSPDSLQGYMPAQLYNLTSSYGTKEELQSLTWQLNHAGIRPIADIVINHRCADIQNVTGHWNLYGWVSCLTACVPT